jgi:acyl-CoA synthetase (AMP-forming)/AMP-acid ligase II
MKVNHASPPQGTIRDWLLHRAYTQGTEPAYIFCDGAQTLTWQNVHDHARDIAAILTKQGIAKGESIAIILPNSYDAILCLFGVLYGGFQATVINLAAGDDAMAYALEHCEARFAYVGAAQMEQFDRVRPTGLRALELPQPDLPPVDTPLHDLSAQDAALLMYTSGTTGQPKGVVHSHSSLLAGGWTPTVAHELTPQDRGLCVLPICHINGLCVTVMGALVSGGSLAIAPKFSASRFWEQCAESGVTWFSIVPTIISHLLHSDINPTAETRARLRFGRSASAPLAPDVQTAFETRFGLPIIETMGLTETAAQILSNPPGDGIRKIGSPGLAYGNQACILSPELRPLPAGVEGEIAVRGPNVMREYLKNPEATKASFTPDGWLRTGDLGKVDEDGYYFVTGRLKELIIKGGENIAPREIDEALYSNPDVIEAAAYARPCKTYGERVEAAVKISEDSSLTEAELIEICHSKLGKFKSPDRVYILEDLPKGPSGKIQRRLLAEMKT